MKKTLFTENYGLVTIKDVMVDGDGTCLTEGVNIHDSDGKLIAEIIGVSSDDITDGDDADNLIENNE